MPKHGKVAHSLGWSAIGEFSAKLIGPISTLILARLLTPADFGILAVCNMVLFFFDIIVDAGFGKYIVQREFPDKETMYRYADVGFWSSVVGATVVWMIIALNRHRIGDFLGHGEYGDVIAVFTLQMVIVTAVSMPLSLMRRDFEFRKLALFRVVTSAVPLVITVPVAFITRSYWALIIGSFAGHITQGVMMMFLQRWHPTLYWSFDKLKEMFGYSFWSMCEGMAHWLIFWVDTFILTKLYDSYYVGLYKNSSSLVMSLYLLIATSFVPVLFSTLSRLKDREESYSTLLSILRLIALIILPMTVLIVLNRAAITSILLGAQWAEAAYIIASWAVIMCFSILIYSFPAEAFKATGRPMILFFYQLSFLSFLIPICLYFARQDFWSFVNARAGCTIIQVILFVFFATKYLKWNLKRYIQTLYRPLLQTLIFIAIFTVQYFVPIKSETIDVCLSLVYSIVIYLIILYCNRGRIRQALSELK